MSMSSADAATPVALVDLGDTLAECSLALREALAGFDGPAAGREDRRRAVMATPGFWRALQPRAAGFELLDLLRDAGFRVHVLTKGPQDFPHVWAEKVAWCRAHLPQVPVIVTDEKARVHGHVLVDDWLPYVDSWQRQWPHGLAIVPAHPWNADQPAHPLRLRDDGRDSSAVIAALNQCRQRVVAGLIG